MCQPLPILQSHVSESPSLVYISHEFGFPIEELIAVDFASLCDDAQLVKEAELPVCGITQLHYVFGPKSLFVDARRQLLHSILVIK